MVLPPYVVMQSLDLLALDVSHTSTAVPTEMPKTPLFAERIRNR